ncbi:unnamed protein product [Amoebophrya sp. A25]|nr:unnamed protein product [Amoebophrya sp. A25]|eukprot:GSA25T00018417001.1
MSINQFLQEVTKEAPSTSALSENPSTTNVTKPPEISTQGRDKRPETPSTAAGSQRSEASFPNSWRPPLLPSVEPNGTRAMTSAASKMALNAAQSPIGRSRDTGARQPQQSCPAGPRRGF